MAIAKSVGYSFLLAYSMTKSQPEGIQLKESYLPKRQDVGPLSRDLTRGIFLVLTVNGGLLLQGRGFVQYRSSNFEPGWAQLLSSGWRGLGNLRDS